MREKAIPLLLSLVALTACSSKGDGSPFDPQSPDLSDDSGATSDDAGKGGGVATPVDDAGEDATTKPTTGHADSGKAEASDGDMDDASAMQDAEGDGAAPGDGETGRLVGMTAAHNAVRAMVSTQPALPPLKWSTSLAAYAQQWATQLASDPSTCMAPMHRPQSELESMNYGENLAAFSGRGQVGDVSTAQQAVNGWASEVACWTYGTIEGTEQCNMTCTTNLNSDGCGHYTQIVWRHSLELGCGVATCQNGQYTEDIWICNYSPAGNIVGQAPY
jgi:pathogenesis-related protein 1